MHSAAREFAMENCWRAENGPLEKVTDGLELRAAVEVSIREGTDLVPLGGQGGGLEECMTTLVWHWRHFC